VDTIFLKVATLEKMLTAEAYEVSRKVIDVIDDVILRVFTVTAMPTLASSSSLLLLLLFLCQIIVGGNIYVAIVIGDVACFVCFGRCTSISYCYNIFSRTSHQYSCQPT
jgi:hypothetical protein